MDSKFLQIECRGGFAHLQGDSRHGTTLVIVGRLFIRDRVMLDGLCAAEFNDRDVMLMIQERGSMNVSERVLNAIANADERDRLLGVFSFSRNLESKITEDGYDGSIINIDVPDAARIMAMWECYKWTKTIGGSMNWTFTLIGNAIKTHDRPTHYYDFRDVDFSAPGALGVSDYSYNVSGSTALDQFQEQALRARRD